MDDTFSEYLSFLESRPDIFKLDECKASAVSLNCWDIHLSFTASPEGQASYFDVLDVSRQFAGIDTEVDEDLAAGLVIRECDIVHLKQLLNHMESITSPGQQ
jgi:hypothetical protein